MESIYQNLDVKRKTVRGAFLFSILEIAEKNIASIQLLGYTVVEITYENYERDYVLFKNIWDEFSEKAIKNVVNGEVTEKEIKQIQKYLKENVVDLINQTYYNKFDIRKDKRIIKNIIRNMKVKHMYKDISFDELVLLMKKTLKDVILDLKDTQNNLIKKLLFLRLKNYKY